MAATLPEPCYDASECIRSLFEYMDLKYVDMVKGKINKINKMGNDNFEMAHPSKTLARCYANGKGRPSVVKATKEQMEKLSSLFRFYCQLGEKRNYQFMSRQQFLRFARDASLVSYDIDLIELDLLFDKINVTSGKHGDHQLRLSEPEFVIAIASAAVRLYPDMDNQSAFDFVMEGNVLPLFDFIDFEDVIGNILVQDNALKLMHEHEKILKAIFAHYCSQDEIVGRVTFADRVAKQTMLSQGAMLKLAGDFRILPELLSAAKVSHCFQQTMFGVRGNKKAADFVDFSQFLECLARMALLAYNFRERPVEPPTVSFGGDDYSREAKRLWFGQPNAPNAVDAPMMVETEPMEVRVISPTRRRADKSTGPPPPFLGYSQQPRALESLLSAQMGLEATDKGMESLVKNNPGHIGDLKRIEKNLQLALGAQSTLAVTADGRPASARGATRRRPPSANSRAKPLQQAFLVSDAEEGAIATRSTLSQRAVFSSEWIGKPKKPLLGDRTATLPHYNRFRNSRNLYQTDGIMQLPEDAPTVYHSRMHEMVGERIGREQMIDGMIMSWHLEGRDLQRQKLQEKQMGRLELMDKSCQLPKTQTTENATHPSRAGRLMTSQDVLVQAISHKKTFFVPEQHQ